MSPPLLFVMATFRDPRYLLTLFSVRRIESAETESCFSVAVQSVSKPQKRNAPGSHDSGKTPPRANAFQRLCLQCVASLYVNTEKGKYKAAHCQKHQTQRRNRLLCLVVV